MIKSIGILGAASILFLASSGLSQTPSPADNAPPPPAAASPATPDATPAPAPEAQQDVPPASPVTVAPATPAAQAPAPAQSEQQQTDAYSKALQTHLAKFNQYPAEARKQGLEGTVIVHMKLDREGKLLSEEVAQGSGNEILDKAARKMVQAASPYPAMPQDFFADAKIGEFMVPIVYMK